MELTFYKDVITQTMAVVNTDTDSIMKGAEALLNFRT